MTVRGAGLFAIIERIKEHYENNINDVYVRKAFAGLEVPHNTWDQLDGLTTKINFYRIHGYPLQDLYEPAASRYPLHLSVPTRPAAEPAVDADR